MASDEIKKLVREQMPGFEAVTPDPDDRRARRPAPDQQSRPAADWKRKLQGAASRKRAPKRAARRDDNPAAAPSPAPSRDAFFGEGDPRERLRARAAAKYRDGQPDADQKTLIVRVRPTDPPSDARAATPKAVVIKKGKIVGRQG